MHRPSPAQEKEGPGLTHSFPQALLAHGCPAPQERPVPGTPGSSQCQGPHHLVLLPHPTTLASPPLSPQMVWARWGPQQPYGPRHGHHNLVGLGELSQVSGNKSVITAKLNAQCSLHVENKPGQSYGRYFQAGRAEMLPARWVLVGREKGRRWRKGAEVSSSKEA